MNKTFVSVLCAMFLFLGVVVGFLLAPIKKGVYCGNNNGNRYCPDVPIDPDEEDYEPDDQDDIPF